MFKIGEMFVAFVGKDGGLARTMKTMEGMGKATGKVMERAIKEGAKMGQAGIKGFTSIANSAAKCAAQVTKSFERITTAGIKAAGRIAPAFTKSFDRIVGHGAKFSTQLLKSLTTLGKAGIGALGKGVGGGGGAISGMGSAMKGLADGVAGASRSIVGGLGAIGSAATACFTAMTWGIAGVVAAGAGLAALIGITTMMAADSKEMQSKFDTVFGSSAGKATEQISKMASAMGRSHNELKLMASGVQDLLVPIGFARDKAAEMSVKLTQLAVDIASFNNKSDTEVMEDISAALAGSGEVMKKYGVILNDVTMKQELASMGYKGATDKASEQMKALARLNIIIKGTSDAHGDAVKTGGSFSNQMKRIMGLIKDIGTNIGFVFVPAAETFAKFFSDNLQLISENSESLEQYGDVLKGWAEAVVMWMQRLITLVVNWKDISAEAFNVMAAVARASLDILIQILDNVEIAITNMFGHLIDFFPNLFETIAEQHGSLWEFMKKGWGDVWEYVFSGGTDGNDVNFSKLVEGMKAKMRSLDFKPVAWSSAFKEMGRLVEVIDSKMGKPLELPKLDDIKAFNPADAGIEAQAAKTIKFEMSAVADLWKQNLEKVFEDQEGKSQLEVLKKGVQVQEEIKEQAKEQNKELKGINDNIEKWALIV